MSKVLPIIVWPDKRLHQQAEEVEVIDEQVKDLIADMITTIKAHNAIGLAAPQVGVQKQLIVLMDINDNPIVIINPEILEVSKTLYTWEEGCLSVPGYFKKGSRPQRVVLKFTDENNNHREVEFQGLFAFAVLHEIDHLNGKVFVDDLSSLKKRFVKNKIKKSIKQSSLTFLPTEL